MEGKTIFVGVDFSNIDLIETEKEFEEALLQAEMIKKEKDREKRICLISKSLLNSGRFGWSVEAAMKMKDSYMKALLLAEIAKKTENFKYLELSVIEVEKLKRPGLRRYALKVIVDYINS